MILICILIYSCNSKNDFIQDVYVNETISLNLPQYSEILISGNSIFVEGGVEGIIIYHGIGQDYKIYDRNCSYEPSLACSKIDSINSGIAYCGCCSSVFDINNSGEPINAPALLPLKQYNWSLDNNNVLRIFN
jgi:Rieske Fe-S protein